MEMRDIYKPLSRAVVRKAQKFSPNVYRAFQSKYSYESTFCFVGFKSDIWNLPSSRHCFMNNRKYNAATKWNFLKTQPEAMLY